MSVELDGKHYRSPTGMHNKVNWILSTAYWQPTNILNLMWRILPYINKAPVPKPKKPNAVGEWVDGWTKAFYISFWKLKRMGKVVENPFQKENSYEESLKQEYHWLEGFLQ